MDVGFSSLAVFKQMLDSSVTDAVAYTEQEAGLDDLKDPIQF